ncbi:MAG: glycosyltransferase family 2 protein [Endozoicomonadaceae bacterium]|nr:glycosyltransferase family 2 protein [Endozoicomonadaceae bacterium]
MADTTGEVLLAIVIINYKTPQLVIDCLNSLISEIKDIDAKVIVVDNHSGDDSCQLIQAWIDKSSISAKVILIPSKTNSGFSGGNNLGIKHVEAGNYLLLNSDTVVRAGAIQQLLDQATKDDSAGLISPRLEWPDATPQKSCFRFHTPISEMISAASTGPIYKLFNAFRVPRELSDDHNYYDWTSFACVLIKGQVFKDIGLMDNSYFMYFEDVMFCFRAKQAGWKVLNIPEAHVVHLRGGSSPVKSLNKQRKRLPRYFYESRTRCFFQIYGRMGLLAANMLWMIGFVIASMRRLLSPSFNPDISKNQWRDVWINFLHPLKAYIHPDDYDQA